MIKKVLQGTLIRIGAILPGVSGGMIAAAFNIYSKLIDALDQVTKKPIQAVLSIWEYLLGIFIGILIGFLVIAYVFYLIPIPATLLFIGLILGGIPEIYDLADDKDHTHRSYWIIGVTFILMVGFTLFGPTMGIPDTTQTNFFLWMIVGVLLAISLIVPGLSGTMLMLMIGYYGPLILLGKTLIEAVLTINVELFMANMMPLLFVVIGVVIAFLGLGKLFNYILKKIPKVFYQVVLGIILASPINIIFSLNDDLKQHTPPVSIFDMSKQWYMWLIGLVMIPVGIYIARRFSEDDKNEAKEN
ncbi:MAG TPA: DUF368 domain-containing protein [Acholeplasmataceae bacterium]|nr:DUF368 domain-containing protein [Acholeplasmataceae bacterium]